MVTEHKQVKFRLSSWNKLRRVFYGRKNETFSDYIERIAEKLKPIKDGSYEELEEWR